MTGEAAHPDWNIWGRGGPGLERTGLHEDTESGGGKKRQGEHEQGPIEREDTKNKRREEEGEGDEGEADKHMEPGLEHPGETCTQTGTSGWWRPWTEKSGVEAALDGKDGPAR